MDSNWSVPNDPARQKNVNPDLTPKNSSYFLIPIFSDKIKKQKKIRYVVICDICDQEELVMIQKLLRKIATDIYFRYLLLYILPHLACQLPTDDQSLR